MEHADRGNPDIATVLGGTAAFIGAPAVAILEEVGAPVTRAGAGAHREAMAVLAGPDGALRKTTGRLQELVDVLDRDIVDSLADPLAVLQLYKHGSASSASTRTPTPGSTRTAPSTSSAWTTRHARSDSHRAPGARSTSR